jgi:hypothetical protein
MFNLIDVQTAIIATTIAVEALLFALNKVANARKL